MHKLWCCFAIMLLAQNVAAQEALLHPRIDVGSSFLFRQESTKNGTDNDVYSPRLDAYMRNGANGIFFVIDSGQPQKHNGTVIRQILYALEAGSCVVDVHDGTALASGAECEKPLPVNTQWTVKNRSKKEGVCALTQAETEAVEVPAGKFEATHITCKFSDKASGKLSVSNYWYVPRLGSMVKAVHKGFDSSGTELYSLKNELVSCRLKSN